MALTKAQGTLLVAAAAASALARLQRGRIGGWLRNSNGPNGTFADRPPRTEGEGRPARWPDRVNKGLGEPASPRLQSYEFGFGCKSTIDNIKQEQLLTSKYLGGGENLKNT